MHAKRARHDACRTAGTIESSRHPRLPPMARHWRAPPPKTLQNASKWDTSAPRKSQYASLYHCFSEGIHHFAAELRRIAQLNALFNVYAPVSRILNLSAIEDDLDSPWCSQFTLLAASNQLTKFSSLLAITGLAEYFPPTGSSERKRNPPRASLCIQV